MPTVLESGRPSITAIGARTSRPRPRKRARSVSISVSPTRLALDHGEMCRPDLGLGRRPPAPRRQDGADLGVIFGLHEQLREGRMRRVVGRRRQHELGIGGELDVPGPIAGVGEGQAANLGVVFRRNDDFKHRGDRSVAPDELGLILAEPDIVAVRLDAARLIARGPNLAAPDIAQKDIGAPIVAGGVFAPARNSQIAPPAVAGAGRREHHRVTAVGEQVRLRRRSWAERRCRIVGSSRSRDRRAGLDLLHPGPNGRDIARRPLLQQELGCLNDRLGMKPASAFLRPGERWRWRLSSCPDGAP